MPSDQRLAVVRRSISAATPQLRALSHQLWSCPEVGRAETKAHAALTSLLADLGFQVTPHAVSATGFIASHSPRPAAARPHVALLCEYDALPDVGHACGHNLIATAAVAAGVAVRAAMDAEGVAGRVTVLGTPAEETDGGKIDFIESGFFADVDAALMVHPIGGSTNFVDVRFNGRRDFNVSFEGRASHAASSPWEAINALDAAVAAYQNVALLRQQIRPELRVAGVIIAGGDAANVIPDKTKMAFTLRGPREQDLDQLERRWRACVDAAAKATGCSVVVESNKRPFAPVEANQRMCRAYKTHADAMGVGAEWHHSQGGSTDAGNVSLVVPTIHPVFHIESQSDCHQREFAKDAGGESALELTLQQAAIIAMTALDILSDAQMRREMEEEFQAWRRSQESGGDMKE